MKNICPNCKSLTDYSVKNPYRPFCSERCRMIDLGDWLMENHSINTDEAADFPETDNGDLVRH